MKPRTLFYLFITLLCLGAIETCWAIDSDGDGVPDADEAIDGTNPANSQSVLWKSLGSWRFSNGINLNGDDGQVPIAQNNVSIVPGFQGSGVQMLPAGSVTLRYRAIEQSTGKPNISPTRGSILFRFKPNWATFPGPGTWITLLQTTTFAVRINPSGSAVMLTNIVAGTVPVQLPIELGTFGIGWSYGLVTYSPEQTSLSWDAPSTRVTGPGIAPPANLNDPNSFIAIGSAADGTGPVNGIMDEVVAFNAPGVLSTNSWAVSATASPVGLNLMWQSPPTNSIVEIKRRLLGSSNWETTRAAIGTSYLDASAVVGERYEYNLNTRVANLVTGLPEDVGTFIKASRAGAPLHHLGKVILLVDKTLTNSIETDLGAYITNLVGDGWEVLRLDVPRHIDDYSSSTSFLPNSVNITTIIAPFIRAKYTQFGAEIKNIICIGHVPIPYTGTIADDGHTSDHFGAWASDLYYGDVDGIWTDLLNLINLVNPFNSNYPLDGKFDQNFIPSNLSGVARLEIPVARIDFANMPAFASSEAVLLNKYLKKNGDYRKALHTYPAEAIAGEYVLSSSQAFELATEIISKASVLKQPQTGDALASPGSFLFGVESAIGGFSGLIAGPLSHPTSEIALGQAQTDCAFYFLRGSYFPDWNVPDNFLRAVLGTPNGGLAVGAFLGINKGWRADGLAVGLPLGTEIPDVLDNWLRPAQSQRAAELLGDPTLRYPVLAPPSSVTRSIVNRSVSLSWTASPGVASAFFVYRSTSGVLGTFERITASPISTTSYSDANAPAGTLTYMVRTMTLSTTGGGTFTNLSQGAFSAPITMGDPALCCISDQAISEDGSLGVAFSIEDAASQSGFSLTATSSNPALAPNENLIVSSLGADGLLQLTPPPNQFGTATISINVQTDAALVVKTFQLSVLSVNDAPSFTKGPDQLLPQAAGPQTVAGWATGISPGPPNESAQQVSFVVGSDNPYLFSVQPAISGGGTLAYTPAPDQRGTCVLTVQAEDGGGTANSGTETSYPQTFSITLGLPQDTDGDGLPDDFEQAYGLNAASPADANQDWDGDGFTNLQELSAGTHPKESRSALKINSAATQGSPFAVQFNSVAGRTYALEAKDDFPSGSWQTLASSLLGTGNAVEELDSDAGDFSSRVYRVATSGPGDEEVASQYAGFYRLNLLGDSDTILSIPFTRPASEFGTLVSASANTAQFRGPPGWTPDQWVYAGGSQSNTYYMRICSGALEGQIYTIIGNTADTLTVESEGSNLAAGLSFGDTAAIIPYWTLGTVFPGGAAVHKATSPGNRLTEVLFPNVSGAGTNLSSAATYYFWSGAWRQVGKGTGIRNDDAIIFPDMYVIVRHNIPANTLLTTQGAVLAGNSHSLLQRNAVSKQDNILALPRPVGVSLNDSGLFGSALRASSSPSARLDELFVFNNAVASKNKAASAPYYYLDGAGWRKVGLGASADQGAEIVFPPGTGVIIRAGNAAGPVDWVNVPTY